MTRVLKLSSSILGEASVSAGLMNELIEGLAASDELEITSRDLAEEGIPHLDSARLTALATDAADRSAAQQDMVDYSDALISELQAADVLILGLPMYNFTLPSMLKAWVDHIARAGVTFKYTPDGPVGLLEDKKVYLVTAMGGMHKAGETDFLRPYVKLIMSFIGLQDLAFITADGLGISPERREEGLAAARAEIEKLVDDYRVEKSLKEAV